MNYRQWRSCGRKVRYRNEYDAQRQAREYNKSKTAKKVAPYRAYYCEYCDGWHFGESGKKYREGVNSAKISGIPTG